MTARLCVTALICGLSLALGAPAGKTKNIIFVMTDGLRVQEVFNGPDPALMTKDNKVSAPDKLQSLYSGREGLMPFLWSSIGKSGQIFGNRTKGSEAYVTNGRNFSYPGYNETLCGFPDDRINSNDNVPNENVTVLEWLHKKPAFRGKVAAFGAWEVIPAIINAQRAGFFVNGGYTPATFGGKNVELINKLKSETAMWDAEPFDSFTFQTALEYLKEKKPRVMYLSLGETDEWAHDGDYGLYLKAAHRVDSYLKTLWDTVQSMPEYRDSTTFIFSTDHGRGEGPVEWRSHGQKIPDSKYMWMTVFGPDTKPLGERTGVPAVTQSQIAATLAALLGEDYNADVAKAGKPLADVLRH